MIRKTLLFLLAVAASLCLAAPPDPKAPPVAVVNAEFGVFHPGDRGVLEFEPTDVVPHQQGQRYGWIIEVRTARRSLAVREEYVLPTPPRAETTQALPVDRVDIPVPRRSQVSQRQLVPVEGRIYGEWSVGPNEPPGHRQLQVVVEGQVAATFEFDVQ